MIPLTHAKEICASFFYTKMLTDDEVTIYSVRLFQL